MLGETITIQVGALSNYAFVHFWKYRDFQLLKSQVTKSPFAFDVLHQIRLSTVLSTPRLLAVDLRETVDFGIQCDPLSLPNVFEKLSSWDGESVTVIRSKESKLDLSKNGSDTCEIKNWLHCLSPSTRSHWFESDILFKLPDGFKSITDVQLGFETKSESLSFLSTFTQVSFSYIFKQIFAVDLF